MNKKGTYYFFYYWFPVLLYCLIIFVQSSYPAVEKIPELPYLDKLIHLAGYALLGLLLLRGFRNSIFRDDHKFIMTASVLLTGLYGASDELHQNYVTYRTGDMWDALFDLLGGVFGVFVYQILTRKYPKIGSI